MFSNNVLITTSYDQKSTLIYNMFNGYFIKYNNNDFKDQKDFLNNKKILDFLKSKDFFSEKNLNDFGCFHSAIIKNENSLDLTINVTKACNFRCSYCYEDFKDLNMSYKEKEIIFKFIKSKIENSNIKTINISWFGGEPLLNKEFIISFMKDLKFFCENNNLNLIGSITTNGYLLNLETFKSLINHNVIGYQITIDGDNKNHDSQRKLKNGNGTYEKILDNLNNILNTDYNSQIVIRTNLTKSMLGNLTNYYKSISHLFTDKRFSAFFHTVVDFDTMEHSITDIELLNEMKISLDYGFKFANVLNYLKPQNNICYAQQKNSYIIESDLKISKCTACNGDNFFYIGYLNSNGELIKNQNYYIWKNAINSLKCSKCNEYKICSGGFCPLYQIKKGFSRCMKFKEDFKKLELLKFADLQKAYNLYIHK